MPSVNSTRTSLHVRSLKEDPLYTIDEVQRAKHILMKIYEKARSRDTFRITIHEGPHKFDRAMQAEAREWFDRWLKRS
jgi:predicted esterase